MKPVALALAALACLPASPARADIVLSQLIVDLQPGQDSRQDIEVWNTGSDRAYVAVEPSEIVNPGSTTEQRRRDPDPEKLGLLVSPARMILEPGQRKLIRVAELQPPQDRERTYRVTVKPVVGKITSAESGLKILVGYDVLVLVRPAHSEPKVWTQRSGDELTFRNNGNVSVELVEGRACDPAGKSCSDLPGKRLYPGAQWTERVPAGRQAQYTLKSPGQTSRKTF